MRLESKRHLALALAAALASGTAIWACSSSKPAPPSPGDPIAQLEADTGVHWLVSVDPRFHTPTLLRPLSAPPPWLPRGGDPEAAARAFFTKYAAVFGLNDPHALVLDRASGPDAHGVSYASFTQVERGVPVLGARVAILFDAAGRIIEVTGLIARSLDALSSQASIDPAAAAAAARADVATRYSADALSNPLPVDPPALVFDPRADPAALAYEVSLRFGPPASGGDAAPAMLYRIDAANGSVRQAVPGILQLGPEVPGSGVGGLGDTKTFSVTASAGPPVGPPYTLQTAGPGGAAPLVVRAPSCAGCPGFVPVSSSSPTTWDTTGPDPGVAVDAYVYFAASDAFWRAAGHPATPILPGGTMTVEVHLTSADSAGSAYFATRDGHWYFGGGAPADATCGPMLSAALGLDSVGHEYTHAVIHAALPIVNDHVGEVSTIDEALSDIAGQFIELAYASTAKLPYAPDTGVLSEGDIAAANGHPAGKRSLRSPHDKHYCDNVHDHCDAPPDCMGGYAYGKNDPHLAIGIVDNAWYLWTYGGVNETSKKGVTAGIGESASRDLYMTLYDWPGLYGHATFRDLALNLTISEATLTDGWTADATPGVSAVACAWYAVGVFDQADLDAFHVKDCTADAGMPPPPATTPSPVPDPPMTPATNPYCLLLGASDVASALQASDVTITDGIATSLQVQCHYFANAGAARLMDSLFTLDAAGTDIEFSTTKTTYPMQGFTVTDVAGLGDDAFVAQRTTATPSGPVTTSALCVKLSGKLWFQLSGNASVDGMKTLAQEILTKL